MMLGKRSLRAMALALALFGGSVHADAEDGTARLEDGASLRWSLSETLASPALGIALPATVAWSDSALDGPVAIDLSTNYAAFIERWELSLYRESDSNRKHPLRRWRGPAAAFDAGVSWDGSVETGPALRPGETVVALLRVRDIAGNIDEAQPQTMLVSRYLMPAQKRKYSAITRARRASVAAGDPPAKQTIPVAGHLLDVEVEGAQGSGALHVSGLAMDDLGEGRWKLSQILPAGYYPLKVQTERPIIGGTRLVSVGRFDIGVPRGSDRFAVVKGTGDLQRAELSLDAQGLERDGAISGRDAVRLTLWKPGDAGGSFALAVADPAATAGLYRDGRGRSVVRVRPANREIPWGAKQEPREPSKPVKMRARYPARDDRTLVLPHTDIQAGKFFVSIRSDTAPPAYLREAAHYDLEPFQGRVFLTDPGRAVIERYRSEAGGSATIEIAYLVRPSIAGMTTHRPPGDAFVLNDNGGSLARLFEVASPEPIATAQASLDGQDDPGWFRRNFGWLMVE